MYRKAGISLLQILIFLVIPRIECISQSNGLIINEILASNTTGLKDEDGDYSDWIEIFNSSSQDVELSGWSLSDDRSAPGKWKFPDIKIVKGSYLVVFASGKNRTVTGRNLHTNFKLSSSGEYLALFSPSQKVISTFTPFYPAQQPDISYGFYSGTYIFLPNPTPGTANQYTAGTIVQQPVFSHDHGFFSNPFQLVMSSPDSGAEIYYTTDGSRPSKLRGTKYSTPVTVQKTTVLRAVAVKGGLESKNVTTATYLFIDDIVHQTNNPPGYPSTWGPYTGITGTAVADYEMDPEVIGMPGLETRVKDALKSLPVISVVTDRNYLFSKNQSPDTGGIYIYTGPPLTNTTNGTGWGWERPASVEYFDTSGTRTFQADCALQIHGGHSRRPEKSPKHSFRIEFKEKFGPSKLNFPLFGENMCSQFDAIVLRAGFNNSWVHHAESERRMAQYVQDIWAKDVQRGMGYPATNSIYTHLYINGIYWGIYSPSEKIDGDFMSVYYGGDPADYDVIKDYQEVVSGDIFAWKQLHILANNDLSSDYAYQILQGNFPDGTRDGRSEPLVDVVNLADYMLINMYAGNSDWDHHNWTAVRSRTNPGKGFRFFCWDEEKILEDKNVNLLTENNVNCPSRVFQQLLKNKNFKRLLADRVQKHFFGNGVLTPGSAAQIWNKRADIVANAVDAESARWGDYRRDVHRYQTAGPFELYTKDVHWLNARNFLLSEFFPQRTEIFINQLRTAGLFPLVTAPEIRVNSQIKSDLYSETGDTLTMAAPAGVIYYTTDGSDPVTWNPVPLPSQSARIYTGKIIIEGSGCFRARTILDGVWSAATEQFIVVKADYKDIKLTEVNYHPVSELFTDESEFEFIEIKNTGTRAIDISGCIIAGGLNYRFETGQLLKPGGFYVISSGSKSFYNKYGFVPDGEFDGQLDNDSDLINMLDPEGDTIFSFTYRDDSGWPETADGDGKTLVPVNVNPGDQFGDPLQWRASYHKGGSPRRDDMLEISRLLNGDSEEYFSLYQNFPNPFSSRTSIPYIIKEESEVILEVYDRYGHKVSEVERMSRQAGEYLAEFNGKGIKGSELDAGVYFYKLTCITGGRSRSLTKTMIKTR